LSRRCATPCWRNSGEHGAALAESRRLYARIERLADARFKKRIRNHTPALDPIEHLSQAESEKIKLGRPGIWRNFEGFWLVRAVEQIRAENEGYSIARTLRKAIKTDPALKNCKPIPQRHSKY
jgi:hypothetical protein